MARLSADATPVGGFDLSVVIPARNEAQHIGAALRSIARQDWPLERLEVVVVDNGSQDETVAVVRAFALAHPALAVQVLHEPVPGVARAKNRGVTAARGHWILFMDADSRMRRDLVEQVMGWTARGYQGGSICIVADSRDLLDRAFFGLMEFGKEHFGIQAQMFYVARALFLQLHGFAEAMHLAEDRDFLQRLQRTGAPLCQVRESWIATSPRRLRRLPLRLNMALMLWRWALANWGIGRDWRY
jgi:glycosyltransferase involved in cell wall biosynthesis